MNERHLEQTYKAILSNPDFDKLGLLIKQPNIFSAFRITNNEIRHSNFLAWLLDPNETHGLGDLFLTRILRDLFLDKKSGDISIVDIPKINLRKAIIHREWHNIDILIETEKFVVAIENKFNSGEHSDQLNKYRKIIKEHFSDHSHIFVFLSAYGISSSDQENYIDLSYERIVEILSGIMDVYEPTLSPSSKLYIHDFITNIKMNVTNNSEANELAKKIYLNHKDLFDFIIDNKPDKASEFRRFFIDKVKQSGWIDGSINKGYIRFLTPALEAIIPKGGGTYGWPNKEAFLFEIDYLWTKNKIKYHCTISPGNEKAREILRPVIENLPNAKKPVGEKWLTYFINHEPFKMEDLSIDDDIKIREIIDKFWPGLEKMVKEVEAAILTKKDELLALKNSKEAMVHSLKDISVK